MDIGLPAGEPKALAAGTVPMVAWPELRNASWRAELKSAVALVAAGLAIDLRQIIPDANQVPVLGFLRAPRRSPDRRSQSPSAARRLASAARCHPRLHGALFDA